MSQMPMLSVLGTAHDVSGANLDCLIACRWSVGSLLFLASFAAVMGPLNYLYHLLSAPRLPFTAGYFGSIIMTLVFAIKVGRGASHAALCDDCR